MSIYTHVCYGCAACQQICPQQAIQMVNDSTGQMHPQINKDRCTDCHLCKSVCPHFQSHPKHFPKFGYAAVCTDKELLRQAASGGVFSALAKRFLECGGVVFGACMSKGFETDLLQHIMIDKLESLPCLQGSKYAHSSTAKTYKQVKEQLESGRPVLFSGTPCQVDGLYGFLQRKHYDNLWTIDLICHGTPPSKLLDDYLSYIEQKNHIQVSKYIFRGKKNGWGKFAYRLVYRSKRGKTYEVEKPANRSSYYWLFLHGAIYRDVCYTCPYATMRRVGDLTIGDWWGIEKEYPEYIGNGANQFQLSEGVSCILVNTEQGAKALTQFGAYLKRSPTAPETISRENKQLKMPQVPPPYRNSLIKLYQEKGYWGIEEWYKKRLGYKYWAYRIWDKVLKK